MRRDFDHSTQHNCATYLTDKTHLTCKQRTVTHHKPHPISPSVRPATNVRHTPRWPNLLVLPREKIGRKLSNLSLSVHDTLNVAWVLLFVSFLRGKIHL